MGLKVGLAPNLPWAIRAAIDRAGLIETHPQRFPELTGETFAPGVRLRRRHKARLRAIADVVRALVRRMDLRTFRVGDQRDDGLCSGVPIAKLQEHTGLSRSRIGRALADLTTAGYLESKQPVEAYTDDDGKERHKGFPSVRWLDDKLFRRLGVTKKITKGRSVAARRWKASHASPASARALLRTRAAVRGAWKNRRKGREYTHGQIARMIELRELHPDWPAERVRAEALRET